MGFCFLFCFSCQLVKESVASQPKTSVRSWFTLQSLQTSFKWTGASFDSGGAAVVLGWPYLLIIISATASLIAVKKGGRPSRRQGQLMMTRDDLQLLTSCRSCSNVKTCWEDIWSTSCQFEWNIFICTFHCIICTSHHRCNQQRALQRTLWLPFFLATNMTNLGGNFFCHPPCWTWT